MSEEMSLEDRHMETYEEFWGTSEQQDKWEEAKMNKLLTMEFFVAGVKFRKDWRENIKELEEGETLQLAPEPTNKFDKDAVQIGSSSGTMLGYVPAKTGEARLVAEALRNGRTLKAILTELSPDFEPWTALQVRIEEVT